MNRLVITLQLILIASFALYGQENAENNTEKAKITFEKKVHDYEVIDYKGNGDYEFEFKNTGNKPLILTNVKSSCGCTIPSWPRDPFEPGEKGKIKVKYNTRIKGKFSKSIVVYSNAENSREVLRIKGQVK